jgi:hypothetical protein
MRGGYRPGSGRKKGFAALEAEKAREYIAMRVSESLKPIVDSLVKQAKGGSIPAIKELFDRAGYIVPKERPQTMNNLIIQIPEVLARKNGLMGKPVEALELPAGRR